MTPHQAITAMKRLLVAFVFLAIPLVANAQEDVVYYHTDAIGSVRMITDASGAEVARYDFLPFGESWNPPTSPDVRQFAGKERDLELAANLDYFGARYYRQQSARFLTVDPDLGMKTALMDPQRWNRYSYVGNRATRTVDPDGRNWESNLFKLGAVLIKGGSIAAEFAGVVTDAETLVDPASSVTDRAFAAISLASEIWSPISVGDVKGLATFAVEHSEDAARFTRSGFRRNLGRATGAIEDGAHAHHMLPVKFGDAFERAGLNLNDPRYGAWWDAQSHLQNAKGYNEQWASFFRTNENATRDEILAFGRQLAEKYGLKVLF